MEAWHVLHAKPHKERQVADYLRAKKLAVYLPFVPVNPVNPRAAHLRPFFPGYLFVKVDLAVYGLSALQWTPGLNRLLQFDDQPASVPDHFIAELKRRVERIQAAGGLKLSALKPGARVRITDGPFAGYEALFDARLADNDRVRVLLEMIQQTQRGHRPELPRYLPLNLNAGSLEPVRPVSRPSGSQSP
jgi:transcriptional antiterminator RfaH